MKTLRMTDRWLRSVTVSEGREEFADAIVRGLRLRVSARSKKWSVVTRIAGKLKRVQIGPASSISLLEARERANDILNFGNSASMKGVVLATQPEKSPLLETLCTDYVEQMKRKGQKSHGEYYRALIKSDHSFCSFMENELGRHARVGEVDASHVAEWLRKIFDGAPSHARHCRAYLHAVFEWAIKAEFDYTASAENGAYGVGANPVSATPGGAKSRARNRVLSKKELKTVWTLLPKIADPRTFAAVRLIISMGGIRISEICHSEWDWYSKGWVTLPKTKNMREHTLPMTSHAKEQFAFVKTCAVPGSRFLFPHQLDEAKPILITSMSRVARRLIDEFELEHFQLRDLRRTMKTQLLDGEYVEEREIDIWHNHGQNSDVARKHYSWAEYKALKLRVAGKIDEFLKEMLN